MKQTLTQADILALEKGFITKAYIDAAGIYRVDDEAGRIEAGVNGSAKKGSRYEGLIFPYLVDGRPRGGIRLRRDFPDVEVKANGEKKEIKKYLAPPQQKPSVYFAPSLADRFELRVWDRAEIVIVEGEKKALALQRYFDMRGLDVAVWGLAGVSAWRQNRRDNYEERRHGGKTLIVNEPIADFAVFDWKGKNVAILFDVNVETNPQVFNARARLGSWLITRGATVGLISLPAKPGVNGVDDFLGIYGADEFDAVIGAEFGAVYPSADAAFEFLTDLVGELSVSQSLSDFDPYKLAPMLAAVAQPQAASFKRQLKELGVKFSAGELSRAIEREKSSRRRAEWLKKHGEETGIGNNKRPQIDIGTKILDALTADLWNAVMEANNRWPEIFRRGTGLVRLERDAEGSLFPAALTVPGFRNYCAKAAEWTSDGYAFVFPPKDLIENALADTEKPLPKLSRVVSVPVFTPAGKLHSTPGLDPESGIYYDPLDGLSILPLPSKIEQAHVDAATDWIFEDMFCDFPFASEADKQNVVALMILPFVRDMVNGQTPIHLLEASTSSAGKSLLCQVAMSAFAGKVSLSTCPQKAEEWSKVITTQLLRAKGYVAFDNLDHHLSSDALCMAVTSPVWDDRILGGNTSANVKTDVVWTLTANNPTLHHDIVKRCVRVRLVPDTSEPELRTGFKYDDLESRCCQPEFRARSIWAAHVLVANWLQQGQPIAPQKPVSRFPEWTRIIGGVLAAAGLTDFLANYREFQAAADTDINAAGALLSSIWSSTAAGLNPARFTTKDVLGIANGIEGLPVRRDKDAYVDASLGRFLAGLRDKIIGFTDEESDGIREEFRITKLGTFGGATRYKLELLSRSE